MRPAAAPLPAPLTALHRAHARRRWPAAAAVGALVAALLAVVPAPGASAAGETVRSFVTTPDGAQRLSTGPTATFGPGSPSGQTITVDPGQRSQVMDGFGASITDSSAALLYRLGNGQRDEVMRSIFSPTEGIGMSWLRQPIGSSDFSDEPHFTYNDIPANETDYDQQRFSIRHDEAQILPLLRRARELNPKLKVMATPWGQPAWMKDNGSLIGGRLKDDPRIYRAYALYLVRFVQAYQAAGVPIYALTVQNEPQNRRPDGYPGTDMPVRQQAAVINELGPLLRANGLGDVKIMSFDHNWEIFPSDVTTTPAGEDPERDYPYRILRTSAAQYIAGTGYHCYSGDASSQGRLHDAFPTKDIWFTECSGFRGNADSDAKAFNDTLRFHIRNVNIASTRNWAKAVTTWNLVLDGQGEPSNGGCGVSPDGFCTGVVELDGGTVTRNAEYYTHGHFSKFVVPGAVRIGSNQPNDLVNVAFENPDGSTVLVVHNVGGGDQNYQVAWRGQVASQRIAPGAVVTLVWPASGGTTPPPTTPPPTTPPPTTPPPTTPPPSPGVIDTTRAYQVVNINSGRCLDVADRGTANGTALQQWDCGSPAQSNQQWRFTATSDGYYRVTAASTPLVWDVDGPTATGDGVKVQLWSPTGAANQQWRPQSLGGGRYQFVARSSGKCLDVRDVSTANGARLQQWTCTGGPAQSFRLG